MKGNYGIETVDQFETMKEALKMLAEYRMADNSNHYYISQRCDKTWND